MNIIEQIKENGLGDTLLDNAGWLMSIFFILVASIVIGACIHNENEWNKIPVTEARCDLVSQNFYESTLESHSAPVMTTNGSFGVAVTHSGYPEQRTTIWNCGKFGTIISNSDNIFRWAKPKSILLIKFGKYDHRIVGIR